jgi:hypothetical protein
MRTEPDRVGPGHKDSSRWSGRTDSLQTSPSTRSEKSHAPASPHSTAPLRHPLANAPGRLPNEPAGQCYFTSPSRSVWLSRSGLRLGHPNLSAPSSGGLPNKPIAPPPSPCLRASLRRFVTSSGALRNEPKFAQTRQSGKTIRQLPLHSCLLPHASCLLRDYQTNPLRHHPPRASGLPFVASSLPRALYETNPNLRKLGNLGRPLGSFLSTLACYLLSSPARWLHNRPILRTFGLTLPVRRPARVGHSLRIEGVFHEQTRF